MHFLRSLAALVIGSATVLLIVTSAPTDASTALSPGSSLMKATLSAIAHERSVHVVDTTKIKNASGKQVTVTIATDAAATLGIQHITYELAGRVGDETVEDVKGVGYLRGDAFILQNYNEFPKSAANKYSMKWISVTKANSGFSALTAGVLMSTIPAEIEMPSPKLLAGIQKVAGIMVRVLHTTVTEGSSSTTGTLFVRTSGAPLPVEQQFTHTGGGKVIVNYSRWNEPVHLTAPDSSVPLSSLE